jgi:hypothetical protein
MFTPFVCNVNDILLEMGRFNCLLWKAWDLMQVCEASPGEGPEYWKTWKRWFFVFCVWWCFMKFCAKTPIVSIFHYDMNISLFSPAYLKPERLMEPEPGSPHRCFSIQFGIPSMGGAEKPSTPVRLGKGCPMDRPSDVLTSSCRFARMFAYLFCVCVYITGKDWYLRNPCQHLIPHQMGPENECVQNEPGFLGPFPLLGKATYFFWGCFMVSTQVLLVGSWCLRSSRMARGREHGQQRGWMDRWMEAAGQ